MYNAWQPKMLMQAQDVVGLVLVYAVIGCTLVAALCCRRRHPGIDARKVIHAGVGMFVFVWWIFTEEWIMLVFFTVPFAFVVLLAMFDGNPVSKTDLGAISNDMGHRIGLFVYVLSINLLVLLFFDGHWTAATIGAVAMTFGDSAGSAIGRRFGNRRILNGKSLEGTMAVFAVTAAVSFIVLTLYSYLNGAGLYGGDVSGILPSWAMCLVAGLVACLSELLCPGQYDNLSNSMTVAVAMVLLGL